MAIKVISSTSVKEMKVSRLPQFLKSKRTIEHDEMVVQIKELQITSANLLKRLQDDEGVETNNYNTHASQTAELISKYQGVAELGSTLIKRLVNVAAALQVPNGISLDGDEKSAEYKYLQMFLDVNQLNEGVAIQLAKEIQFQGQVLTELIWEGDDTNMVRLKYLPWDSLQYTITPIGLSNLTGPYQARWTEDEGKNYKVIKNEKLAFAAFNKVFTEGSIEGWPTLGGLLMRIDAIAKDLRDWRMSNKLYSHPTPVFTCETQEEVNALTAQLTAAGWTVGTAIAFRGKFVLAAAPNYHQTIKEAIEVNVKLVSGGSGLAISWLGFADVMSNRATAESLGEPLEIVSAADMATWRSFYEEMFDNVILLRNDVIQSEQKLEIGKVKPELKPMTDRQWKKLKDIFMPAAEKNLLSVEAFLKQIPDFDVEEELKRQEEEAAAAEPEVDLDEVEEIELEEE